MGEPESPLIALRVSLDGTYVIARMLGEHTLPMMLDATDLLRAFAEERDLYKVLVLAPEQRQMLNTVQTVQVGSALEPVARPRRQYAIVVTMDLSAVRFTETVMINRRMTLRYFNDVDAACAWLGVTREREDAA